MLEDHLEKLRAFYFTAGEGSFLKAGKKLRLTQPAVTKAVKILETHMKTPLFVRHSRGVSLTSKGKLLYEFCESLFLKIRDLEQKIASHSDLSGVIKIGTYETLGELFWPRTLKQMARKVPGVIIELTTEHPESHWGKLASGALDMIVDAEPPVTDAFYARVLYTDSFGVFAAKGSPLLEEKERVPVSYVKRAFDRRGVSIEEHLGKFAGRFELRYSVESFTMVRSLISEGACVGVLPLRLAEKQVKSGAIVPYGPKGKLDHFGEHRICVTCMHDLRNEAKISRIMDMLRESAL